MHSFVCSSQFRMQFPSATFFSFFFSFFFKFNAGQRIWLSVFCLFVYLFVCFSKQRLTISGLRKFADICEVKEISIIAIPTLNVRDVFLLSPPLHDGHKRLYDLTFACTTHPSNTDFSISGTKCPGSNSFVLFSGDPGSPLIEMSLSLESDSIRA